MNFFVFEWLYGEGVYRNYDQLWTHQHKILTRHWSYYRSYRHQMLYTYINRKALSLKAIFRRGFCRRAMVKYVPILIIFGLLSETINRFSKGFVYVTIRAYVLNFIKLSFKLRSLHRRLTWTTSQTDIVNLIKKVTLRRSVY